MQFFMPVPKEHHSKGPPNFLFVYVSQLRICQLFSVVIGAIFEILKWLKEQHNWFLDMLSC